MNNHFLMLLQFKSTKCSNSSHFHIPWRVPTISLSAEAASTLKQKTEVASGGEPSTLPPCIAFPVPVKT